jgi:hypothetical protein
MLAATIIYTCVCSMNGVSGCVNTDGRTGFLCSSMIAMYERKSKSVVWQKKYGRRSMAEEVWQKKYGRRSMAEEVWQKYGRRSMAEEVFQNKYGRISITRQNGQLHAALIGRSMSAEICAPGIVSQQARMSRLQSAILVCLVDTNQK